jgi:hypothetical protein
VIHNFKLLHDAGYSANQIALIFILKPNNKCWKKYANKPLPKLKNMPASGGWKAGRLQGRVEAGNSTSK